jgi:AAA domain-containing protein
VSTNGVHLDFDQPIISPSPGTIRRLSDIPNLQTMEIPPIDYLVPGMISRNTITLWTGADGTAKTFLAMKMAIAVAAGGEFLGRRCQQAEVLYLDYENPSFAIRDRLDLMTGGVIPNLHLWGTWLEHQPPQIGSELLLMIAKESRPLIFIDPFRYSHSAEENDSTEMMAVMQHLRYCAAAGGAVVILHHPAKTEGSTGRGSSCIKGAVDVAFLQEMADPNDGGLITLKCIKNRFGETHPVTIRPNFDEGTFEVTDSPQFIRRTAECEKLLQIIRETPGLSQNALYRQAGMKKSRLISLLKESSGLWEERKDGCSLLYFPVVPKSGNNAGNNGTGQVVGGCSSVPSLYKREQGTIPLRPNLVVPEQIEKPNGKTLPCCPSCGSFALYRDGSCQTCEYGRGVQ